MTNSRDFRGKYGIVTGAASGIGRAAALNLAQAGAGLSLADIEENALKTLAGEVEKTGAPKPLISKTDVSSETDVQALVDKTKAAFGRIDFLVTSAGILRRTKFAGHADCRVGSDAGRSTCAGRSFAAGRSSRS